MDNKLYPRPIVALAWLYGPMTPIPSFMPISLRIGPLTSEIIANELVLLEREAEAAAALRTAIKTRTLGPASWDVLLSPIFETLRGKPEYQDIFAALESHLTQQRDLYLAGRSL